MLTRSQTATADHARGAIRRMHDRTTSAVEQMRDAASLWAPGRDLATRLADAEAGLLPIIDTFDSMVTSGDASLWPKVTQDYSTWYDQTSPVVAGAGAEVSRLGLDC